jgi:hypothetical protein
MGTEIMKLADKILKMALKQLIIMEKLEAGDDFYYEFGTSLRERLENDFFTPKELNTITNEANAEYNKITK